MSLFLGRFSRPRLLFVVALSVLPALRCGERGKNANVNTRKRDDNCPQLPINVHIARGGFSTPCVSLMVCVCVCVGGGVALAFIARAAWVLSINER